MYGGEMDTDLGGKLKERDHLEDLGVDGKLLKWIFKKCDGKAGFIRLMI
jgi:hypothetical protein